MVSFSVFISFFVYPFRLSFVIQGYLHTLQLLIKKDRGIGPYDVLATLYQLGANSLLSHTLVGRR